MPEKAARNSLRGRLQLAGTLPILAFFCFAGVLLDQAVQRYAEAGLRQQLENVFYGLISLVEYHPDHGFLLEGALPTPSLGALNTGLSARVLVGDRTTFWESPSMEAFDLPIPEELEQGQDRFRFINLNSPASHAEYAYAVAWEVAPESFVKLTFQVLQESGKYHEQVRNTRILLLSGAMVLGIVVFAVQALLLRGGLRPLRAIARELHALQAGTSRRLEGEYPQEIQELAEALNSLMVAREAQLERYRNGLADLAHGLKTPLSVIRSSLERRSLPRELAQDLDDQTGRINELIEYHLQRARAAGGAFGTGRVYLAKMAGQLRRTLLKIHHEKKLQVHCEIADDVCARMDAQDMMEVLGNVMENACKWARHEVHVLAEVRGTEVYLQVDDDGPGFPEGDRSSLTQRGVRADERTPGHGFGLAIVRELIELSDGSLKLEDSSLQGASVRIRLPAAVD